MKDELDIEIGILRELNKVKWDRVLPTNELFSDRWEKAKYIGAGQGSSIYDSVLLFGKVNIGSNTWIGPFVVLDGSGDEVVIGDYCSISAGVQVYTHNSVEWSLSGGKKDKKKQATQIGNNCYIGPNCIISLGVIIGNRCVIGANSFVNKSFPDDSIIAGSPAKIIGKVTESSEGVNLVYF